jgi:hypothetical protein
MLGTAPPNPCIQGRFSEKGDICPTLVHTVSMYLDSFNTNYIICKMFKFSKKKIFKEHFLVKEYMQNLSE